MNKKILLLFVACMILALATFVEAGDPSCGLGGDATLLTPGCSGSAGVTNVATSTTSINLAITPGVSFGPMTWAAFCGSQMGIPCFNASTASLQNCTASATTSCGAQTTELLNVFYNASNATGSRITNLSFVSVANKPAFISALGSLQNGDAAMFTVEDANGAAATNDLIVPDPLQPFTINDDTKPVISEIVVGGVTQLIVWKDGTHSGTGDIVVTGSIFDSNGNFVGDFGASWIGSGGMLAPLDDESEGPSIVVGLSEDEFDLPAPDNDDFAFITVSAYLPTGKRTAAGAGFDFREAGPPFYQIDLQSPGGMGPDFGQEIPCGTQEVIIEDIKPTGFTVSEGGLADDPEFVVSMRMNDFCVLSETATFVRAFAGAATATGYNVKIDGGGGAANDFIVSDVVPMNAFAVGSNKISSAQLAGVSGLNIPTIMNLNNIASANGGFKVNGPGSYSGYEISTGLTAEILNNAAVCPRGSFDEGISITSFDANGNAYLGTIFQQSVPNLDRITTPAGVKDVLCIPLNPVVHVWQLNASFYNGVLQPQIASLVAITSGTTVFDSFYIWNMTVDSGAVLNYSQTPQGGWGHSTDWIYFVLGGRNTANNSAILDYFNISMGLSATNPNGTTRFTTDKQVVIATYNPDINILNFQLDFQTFNGTFDTTNGTCLNCSFDGANDPLAGGNGWCQAEVEKIWGMFQNYNLTISLVADRAITMDRLELVCRSYWDTIQINSNCTDLSIYQPTNGNCFTANVPAAYAAYAAVVGNSVHIDLTSFFPNLTNMPFGSISPDATCEQIACEVIGNWVPGDTQEFVVNKTITVTAI